MKIFRRLAEVVYAWNIYYLKTKELEKQLVKYTIDLVSD